MISVRQQRKETKMELLDYTQRLLAVLEDQGHATETDVADAVTHYVITTMMPNGEMIEMVLNVTTREHLLVVTIHTPDDDTMQLEPQIPEIHDMYSLTRLLWDYTNTTLDLPHLYELMAEEEN